MSIREWLRNGAVVTVTVLVVPVFAGRVLGRQAESAGWQPLFDGRTLAGFVRLGGKAIYKVEDGAIVGVTVKGTPNSFLCTKKHYGDFILEFDVKVDPELNSGVQIRSRSLKAYQNGRVHGYQVEIDPSARAFSGGIYDEARRGWLNDLSDNEPARKAFKPGQWNHFRVEAIGDSIKTWVNGVPAADLVDSMTLSGFIGLQVHLTKSDRPLEVRWRNLRIKDLGRHVWKPLFDGKTLNGWHTLPGGKWRVENGVIIGTSPKSEPRHGLLVTDRRFGDFTARLKFKAVEGNSGFYFRCEEVNSIVGVHGFQAEIDKTNDVGGLYETGGRAWVVKPRPEDVKKWFKPGQWNRMTVSAHGRRIVVHVNGYKTAELKDDPGRLEGHLALQLHGSKDMHVMFKDIELLVPEEKAGGDVAGVQLKPVFFRADFEDGSLDAWEATDAAAWRIEKTAEGNVLSLFQQSRYKPPVRSPVNINLIKDVSVGSFTLELKAKSTKAEYPHRDLCLVFGYRDPSHFYYVHLASRADPHANSIFVVDGAPRVSIATERTTGTKWGESWHKIRLVRDADSGDIEVFFDDMMKPVMTARDDRFKSGKVGVGSFDDTGWFDDVTIFGTSR